MERKGTERRMLSTTRSSWTQYHKLVPHSNPRLFLFLLQFVWNVNLAICQFRITIKDPGHMKGVGSVRTRPNSSRAARGEKCKSSADMTPPSFISTHLVKASLS
jgi:hypothetical protein